MGMKQISISRAEHRAALSRETRGSGREQVPLRDLSDCLLAAYEGVSGRAFRLHQARGAQPGNELKHWKEAERDLLGAIPVDVVESEKNIYALASVPGYAAAEISVAVEDRWLLISGYGHSFTAWEAGAGAGFGPQEAMRARGEPAVLRAREQNGCEPLDWRGAARRGESFEDCAVRRPFCVVELGHKVDAARSTAVLANGMVAVRMAKARAEMPAEDNNERA
jgi:HSP20 family molecular chaperone IbpA